MTLIPYVAAGLLGLILGSFVNVVIYRGPALWGLVGADRGARGTLWGPRSKCPTCGDTIAARDLIPILSYVALGGKCRSCAAAIPVRYPLIEAFGAATVVLAALVFGFTLAGALAALFFLALLALAGIDWETGYLPEAITLPLIGAGLAANLFDLYTDKVWALIGAAAGYGGFFLIATAYRRLRGRDGLGLGDAALFAAIGAWGGWPVLAPAAFLGALFALLALSARSALSGKPIDPLEATPFGPALCAGGALAFIASRTSLPWFA
ncbi:MAG: prepilin peptidase [Parvularculaceae bacterium]|nr:prepilin peptidase [Parvularculaceae bacterium]